MCFAENRGAQQLLRGWQSAATLDFDVLKFSSSVKKAPSHISGSGDAHCSARSVQFAILCLFLIGPVKSFLSLVTHTEAHESQIALHVSV